MLYDKENLMFDNKAVSDFSATATYSDAIKNGQGAAYENAKVSARVTGAPLGGSSLTLRLQTADDEAFTSPSYIGEGKTFLTSFRVQDLHTVLPITADAKAYVRMEATGSGAVTGDGKLTAGVVIDEDQQ